MSPIASDFLPAHFSIDVPGLGVVVVDDTVHRDQFRVSDAAAIKVTCEVLCQAMIGRVSREREELERRALDSLSEACDG
jgi:hypothetical protein